MKTKTAPSTRSAAKITTEESAGRMRNHPQTWRASFCRHGHYLGMVPAKLPNGRLLWDADEVDALVAGQPAKTPDAAQIDEHEARKAAGADKVRPHIRARAEAKAKRLAALTAGEAA